MSQLRIFFFTFQNIPKMKLLNIFFIYKGIKCLKTIPTQPSFNFILPKSKLAKQV